MKIAIRKLNGRTRIYNDARPIFYFLIVTDLILIGFCNYSVMNSSEGEVLKMAVLSGLILLGTAVVIIIFLRSVHWSLTLDQIQSRLIYSQAWNLTKPHRIIHRDEVASITVQKQQEKSKDGTLVTNCKLALNLKNDEICVVTKNFQEDEIETISGQLSSFLKVPVTES